MYILYHFDDSHFIFYLCIKYIIYKIKSHHIFAISYLRKNKHFCTKIIFHLMNKQLGLNHSLYK